MSLIRPEVLLLAVCFIGLIIEFSRLRHRIHGTHGESEPKGSDVFPKHAPLVQSHRAFKSIAEGK